MTHEVIDPLPSIDEIRETRADFVKRPKVRSPLPPIDEIEGSLTIETRIPLPTVQEQSPVKPIDPARVPHLEEIEKIIDRMKSKRSQRDD